MGSKRCSQDRPLRPASAVQTAIATAIASLDAQQTIISKVLEPGEPERIALLLFDTLQNIAALATAGIVAPEQVDTQVADAIARFLDGARIHTRA